MLPLPNFRSLGKVISPTAIFFLLSPTALCGRDGPKFYQLSGPFVLALNINQYLTKIRSKHICLLLSSLPSFQYHIFPTFLFFHKSSLVPHTRKGFYKVFSNVNFYFDICSSLLHSTLLASFYNFHIKNPFIGNLSVY